MTYAIKVLETQLSKSYGRYRELERAVNNGFSDHAEPVYKAAMASLLKDVTDLERALQVLMREKGEK